MWLGGGVHRTAWFFLGVCSITHFVCLVGVFSVTPSRLICLELSRSFNHWRYWRPPSIRSASPRKLAWSVLVDTCSLGRFYSPGEFHVVLNRSVPSAFIWTGCFCHTPCRTSAWGTDWPSPAIAKLGRLDLPVVGIPSNRHTGGVGCLSCQTHLLLLFGRQLSLVLSLIRVGGG